VKGVQELLLKMRTGIRNRVPSFIAILFIAVLVGIDQLTKLLVVRYIEYRGSVVVLKGVFDFTHWRNDGAAFGILSGQQTLLITVTGVFLAGGLLLLLLGKIRSKGLLTSFTLIIAGGIGNFIDRVLQGYVVDFIELKFINFAIFNFADMCAVCGSILLVFVAISEEIREYQAKRACSDADVTAVTDVTIDGKEQEIENPNNSDKLDKSRDI